MAKRLSDEHRRLDELKTGDQAVRACFEVSFAHLPGRDGPDGVDPAHAFRMLGLWQGVSLPLPAAAAILGQPELRVADALEVLVDAQLLQSPDPDRYQFHSLLKAYAAERASTGEPAEAAAEAVRRVLTWYLRTAAAAAELVSPHRYRIPLPPCEPGIEPLSFDSPDQALAWCETERVNLVAATRQAAAAGQSGIAWQLPVELMSFFNRRGYLADWRATHHAALAAAERMQDRPGQAWVLNNLGMVYARQRMAEAVDYFERALVIRRDLGDQRGEAQAANNLADTYLMLGRFADAIEPLERALELQRKAGNSHGEGVVLNNLGEAYLGLGRAAEAFPYLERALECFRQLDANRGQGYTLHNLGKASLESGQLAAASDYLNQALAIHSSSGDRYGEALTLRHLGEAEHAAGHADSARTFWTRALVIFGEIGADGQSAEVSVLLKALDTENS